MMLRWLGKNLRVFVWAFLLAVAVWVVAVTSADPDETHPFPNPIPLEVVGQDPGLVITGNIPQQIEVILRAPRSVWERLSTETNNARAALDLSGLDAGPHTLDIQVQIPVRPVRIVSAKPASVAFNLEPLATHTLPVDLTMAGELPIGYQAGEASLEPQEVILSGPETIVNQVARVHLTVNLAEVREDIDQSLPVQALDGKDQPLSGVTINPDAVHIKIPISQQGGYRDMAVKVVVHGQVASGYRLTNISAFPPVVTLFSTDLQLVNALPGYVETQPLDLNAASNDLTTHLGLNLPAGISVVGEQNVTVQVGVAAIQSSLTLSNKKVEISGLAPGLTAQISPARLDVILSGPLPALDTLSPQDVRVVVDVSGLAAGTHQLTPKVEILVADVRVESILPETVEVVLTASGTPTPTLKP